MAQFFDGVDAQGRPHLFKIENGVMLHAYVLEDGDVTMFGPFHIPRYFFESTASELKAIAECVENWERNRL